MTEQTDPIGAADAKKFIKEEVHALLKKYFFILVAVAGIPNAVVLCSLWFSVNSTANSVAKAQAENSAKQSLVANQKRFDDLTATIIRRTEELDHLNTDLLVKVGAQRAAFEPLPGEVEALKTSVKTLQNADLAKAATIISTLNSSSDAKNILTNYNSLQLQSSQLVSQIKELVAHAQIVDDALDRIGQAGSGGVWNIFFNRLNITPTNNFKVYAEWMDSIHTDAVKRSAVRSQSVTNPQR